MKKTLSTHNSKLKTELARQERAMKQFHLENENIEAALEVINKKLILANAAKCAKRPALAARRTLIKKVAR